MSESFGQTLRRLRLDSGIGLRELARRIGRSPGYLSDVENDHVPPPSEEVIISLAAVIGARREVLLRAARRMDPDLARYVAEEQQAADFLRLARRRRFAADDWERIRQLAEIARLGHSRKDNP